MSEEFVIVLPGEPVPWAEKKEARATGNRFFPKRQERAVRAHLKHLETYNPRPLPFGPYQPLQLSCVCYVHRPAYHYGTGRNAETIKPQWLEHRRPIGKPDLSNCVKLAEDVLVLAKLIPDDKQIVGYYKPFGKIFVATRHGEKERTVLRIKAAR